MNTKTMSLEYVIHRTEVRPMDIFSAPENVTFGYQTEREQFSVWYDANAPMNTRYIVVATGSTWTSDTLLESFTIHSTVIISGYYAFHLLKETK